MSRYIVPDLRFAVLGAALAALAALAPAARCDEAIQTGFQERVFRDAQGDHKYTVFLPADYTPDKKWPAILYLHNASDNGTDNKLPLVGGLGPQIRARAATFPFIVVIPQCEDRESRLLEGWKSSTPDGMRALRIFDAVERDFSVDRNREIITGWSMGAAGAWSLAAVQPARWSAMVCVAGSGDPTIAARLKNIPIWAFHGTKDLAVPIDDEKCLVDAVRRAGGRAYFTPLPDVRHNVGHVVYGNDLVYEWMLNPQSEPRPESFVRTARRPPTDAEMGHDFVQPFIAGVEIPQAAFVRLDKEAIEALAGAVPGLIPEEMLSGVSPNIYQSQRAFLLQFEIALSGINYRGTVERLQITTHNDGWATISIGLRNMTMEVASTTVNGGLVSATAGPMDIVIGQESPVWLTVKVRPYIQDRKLRFELGDAAFNIPDDNWYVTTPQVVARGIPFLRGRVSEGVTSKLVNGAYGRKAEIEAQVVAAAPAIVRKLEEHLDRKIGETRTFGTWPVPAYQPRFRLYPDRIQVDESGLALIVGMSVGRPAFDTRPRPVRVIKRPPLSFADIPQQSGLQVGMSSAILEGLSSVMVDSRVARGDVRDLGSAKFAALGDSRVLAAAIPDLARYGEHLEARVDVQIREPLNCRKMREAVPGSPGPNETQADRRRAFNVELELPSLVFLVDIKTSPLQAKWTRCAEFDLRLKQPLNIWLQKPAFDSRVVRMEWPAAAEIEVAGRFADGYVPIDRTFRPDVIEAQFRAGWCAPEYADLLQRMDTPDFVVGTAKLRATELKWIEPFLVRRYLPARTRITNNSSHPIVYSVRGPFTKWGAPLTLPAGKSHEFQVPYPLTIRPISPSSGDASTLPMGADFVLKRPSDPSHSPQLARTASGDASSE